MPPTGSLSDAHSGEQYHQSHRRLYGRETAGVDWLRAAIRRPTCHGKGFRPVGTTRDIRDAIEAELAFDPLVDPTDIMVRNINGDVALNGTVPSYPQYLEAAAAAQRIRGVKNVHNHLEVMLPEGDYRDDALLTTAANDALAQNVTVPDGVEVTARNGNLELTGTVGYGQQRDAAERAVAGLTGVRHVRDEIEVGYDADPADVTLLVGDALARSALIPDDSDVAVEATGNTVTLTGTVRTWAEHDAVVGAAWMARGVSDVHDLLEVAG
jgi:osmotically-inducible protein OsmY